MRLQTGCRESVYRLYEATNRMVRNCIHAGMKVRNSMQPGMKLQTGLWETIYRLV